MRCARRVDIRLAFAHGGEQACSRASSLQFNAEVAERAKVAENESWAARVSVICIATSAHAGAGRPLAPNSGRVLTMPVDESSPAGPKIELSRCRLEDVEIAFAQAGRPEGELLILLHGFPEHWGAWRHHMVRLAHAGFFVVAPDQRGYGLSGKPAEVADYDLDRLVADVVGL